MKVWWWEMIKKSTRKSEREENTALDAAPRVKKPSSPKKKNPGATSNSAIPVGDVNKSEPTSGHRAPVPTEVQGLIAQCAYDLYAQRGFQHGYHEGDWLEAEKQVLAQTS